VRELVPVHVCECARASAFVCVCKFSSEFIFEKYVCMLDFVCVCV